MRSYYTIVNDFFDIFDTFAYLFVNSRLMTILSSDRFRKSTRGKVLELLRRGERTIDEMAVQLGLTDNAIRAQLATLERDGLVRQHGVRRGPGAGKPALVYSLSNEAEEKLSQAYAPVLAALLEELAGQLTEPQLEALLMAVGRRIAAGAVRSTGSREARVNSAVDLLNALGGDARVEKNGDNYVIRGCGCPLSTAVARRPETCTAIQSLLSEVIGAGVTESCDRGERPNCCFTVPIAV